MIYKIIGVFRRWQNRFYSIIISKTMLNTGPKIYIEYPARIIGGKNISIGDGFSCFSRLRLEAFEEHNGIMFRPKVTIGKNVSINFDCHIGCVNRISIGDNVLIASRVFITDHFHGDTTVNSLDISPSERHVVSKGPVIIGDNVWIGEGVAIMPNTTIGKNCIIGANAVVTKSFPDNSVIGGIPASLIKKII